MQYCKNILMKYLTEVIIFNDEEVGKKPKCCSTFWVSPNGEIYFNLFQELFNIFHHEKVIHTSSTSV